MGPAERVLRWRRHRALELLQPYLVPFFFKKVFLTLRWRVLSSKVANPPLSRVTDSSTLEMLLPKAGRGNEHRCFRKLLPDGLLDGAQGRAGLRQPARQAESGWGGRLHVNPVQQIGNVRILVFILLDTKIRVF